MQMLGSQAVAEPRRRFGVGDADQSSVLFETGTGQVSAVEVRKLFLERLSHQGNQRRMPGDESTRTGTVFGLRDQVARQIIRTGRSIGQNHDLAGSCDTVDADLA